MAQVASHVSRVRALYKGLLKLHRGLPLEMKAVGDQYMKEEFRLHKAASNEEAEVFLQEWTKYYLSLAKQLSKRKKTQDLGSDLSPQVLENFREEQLGQLFELFKETAKDSKQEKPQV